MFGQTAGKLVFVARAGTGHMYRRHWQIISHMCRWIKRWPLRPPRAEPRTCCRCSPTRGLGAAADWTRSSCRLLPAPPATLGHAAGWTRPAAPPYGRCSPPRMRMRQGEPALGARYYWYRPRRLRPRRVAVAVRHCVRRVPPTRGITWCRCRRQQGDACGGCSSYKVTVRWVQPAIKKIILCVRPA